MLCLCWLPCTLIRVLVSASVHCPHQGSSLPREWPPKLSLQLRAKTQGCRRCHDTDRQVDAKGPCPCHDAASWRTQGQSALERGVEGAHLLGRLTALRVEGQTCRTAWRALEGRDSSRALAGEGTLAGQLEGIGKGSDSSRASGGEGDTIAGQLEGIGNRGNTLAGKPEGGWEWRRRTCWAA